MSIIGESREYSVVEERQFTNPVVRFRRINGRIIPIVNKKRVGQGVTATGQTLTMAGAAALAAAAAATAIKRTKAAKAVSAALPRSSMRVASKGAAKIWRMVPRTKATIPHKVGGFLARASFKTVRTVVRNPGKLGLLAAGMGLLATSIGTRLEMESQFGKDILGGE